MSKSDEVALKLASTYLRANPEASLDEIAEVISQFGGLSGPAEREDPSSQDVQGAASD